MTLRTAAQELLDLWDQGALVSDLDRAMQTLREALADPMTAQGCAECGAQAKDGWALYCVGCINKHKLAPEPVCWIHKMSGRVRFAGDKLPPSWVPLYRRDE